MAAWINLTFATMERGLREDNTNNSFVIHFFLWSERITGVHRVYLYFFSMLTITLYLLFGSATDWICTQLGLFYPLLVILLKMIPGGSSVKLPRYSSLFSTLLLVDMALSLFSSLPQSFPSGTSVAFWFYRQFKRYLILRCFIAITYGPVRRLSRKAI